MSFVVPSLGLQRKFYLDFVSKERINLPKKIKIFIHKITHDTETNSQIQIHILAQTHTNSPVQAAPINFNYFYIFSILDTLPGFYSAFLSIEMLFKKKP